MKTPWPGLGLWRITLSVWRTLTACACAHSPMPPSCPSGANLRPDMFFGEWQVQLAGATVPISLRLGPHPEHAGSLKGELMQGQHRYAVVADWDEGEFTLEESRDGVRIAATWLGKVQSGSCAQIINGTRQAGSGAEQHFEMRSERLR